MAQPTTGKLKGWLSTVKVECAENGNAKLPMDLFVTPAYAYGHDWVSRTMPFRAFFNPCYKRNGLVDTDHECTRNDEAGRAAWLVQVNNDIFSK